MTPALCAFCRTVVDDPTHDADGRPFHPSCYWTADRFGFQIRRKEND